MEVTVGVCNGNIEVFNGNITVNVDVVRMEKCV